MSSDSRAGKLRLYQWGDDSRGFCGLMTFLPQRNPLSVTIRNSFMPLLLARATFASRPCSSARALKARAERVLPDSLSSAVADFVTSDDVATCPATTGASIAYF